MDCIMGEYCDDLHSIAFRSGKFHDLGVLNTDMSSQIYMDSHSIKGTPNAYNYDMMYSSNNLEIGDDDFSTGYLEDVLFEFSSKKRRLLLFAQDQLNKDHDDHYLERCWTSDHIQNCCENNIDTLSQITKCDRISDLKETVSETYDYSSSSANSQKESSISTDDTRWTPDQSDDVKGSTLFCMDPPLFSSGDNIKTGKKRVMLSKVVYPFAMVKPGGFEGDATLNDINERILMPPTRPVRHPVGDFACRPLVSPHGPGLSGKAVVAFTKVHTQGNGTITIIRTKG